MIFNKIGGAGGAITVTDGTIDMSNKINALEISESWVYSSTQTLPTGEFRYGDAVVLNGYIYLMGGTYYNTQFYKWNIGTSKKLEDLPYNFVYGSAVVLNGEIHILGGNGYNNCNYKWDGTSWAKDVDLPIYLSYGCAVVLNGEIHILGGSNSLTSHYKFDGTKWTQASTLPYSFTKGSAVVLNGEIHILGGSGTGVAYNHYKWDGTSWAKDVDLPVMLVYGKAIVNNGMIYIVSEETIDNVRRLNAGNWEILGSTPYNFASSPIVMYNNAIYTLGTSNNDYMNKYAFFKYNTIDNVDWR